MCEAYVPERIALLLAALILAPDLERVEVQVKDLIASFFEPSSKPW
jgi:hypothetical protein